MKIEVVPTSKASLRTKNRIREHGPTFTVKDRRTPICLGEESLLLRAPDGWDGWLPLSEIQYMEIE